MSNCQITNQIVKLEYRMKTRFEDNVGKFEQGAAKEIEEKRGAKKKETGETKTKSGIF